MKAIPWSRKVQKTYSRIIRAAHVDLSNQSLPKVTGCGPFVELLKFRPIGTSGALLNIQIPQSGHLKIRSASIVALNGSVEDLEAELRPFKQGVWYQSLRLRSPVSLLVSGGRFNYLLLKTHKGENWLFKDLENVIAWSGCDLSVSPRKSDTSISSLHSEGNGTIVVQSILKLFEVNVEVGESILVAPSAIIASNVTIDKRVELRDDHKSRIFLSPSSLRAILSKLPKIHTQYFSRIYRTLKERLRIFLNLPSRDDETPLSKLRSKLRLSLKRITKLTTSLVATLFKKDEHYYYAVDGPAKILIVEQPRFRSDLKNGL